MDPKLRAVAEAAKGFMPLEEGLALYEAGIEGAQHGPLLEIGTYCGKSSVYLGAAAREGGTVLFTVDHHRGSEEIQPGWEHHDPELIDPDTGRMNSLPYFQRTIEAAGLEQAVIGMVGDSPTISKYWQTPVGLVFIDGAHSEDDVLADYEGWAPKLHADGVLAFHDVFEKPSDGGQGPYRAYLKALNDGFRDARTVGSLRLVRR